MLGCHGSQDLRMIPNYMVPLKNLRAEESYKNCSVNCPEPLLSRVGSRFFNVRGFIICCEVIIWSKFGPFRGFYLVQVEVIIWSKFVSKTYCYSGFRWFLHTQLSFCVCFLWPIIWQFSKNRVFQKRVQKLLVFFFKFLCFKFKL